MSEKQELGKVSISPQVVEVGSSPLLKITYIVGPAGIAAGGGIQIRFPNGCWTPAVMAEISVHRYLQVINSDVELLSANANSTLTPRVWHRGVLNSWIDITVAGADLAPGDKIIFTYGVRERESPPVRCQNYAGKSVRFQVLVDAEGTGQLRGLPDSPSIEVRAGKPAQLEVIAPSIIQAGESFPLQLRLHDPYRNDPSRAFVGKVAFSSADNGAVLPEPHEFKSHDGNRATLEAKFTAGGLKTALVACDKRSGLASAAQTRPLSLGLDSPDARPIGTTVCDIGPIYGSRERVSDRINLEEFAARSNPIQCVSGEPEYRMFWGDIHGHSTLSDGELPVREMYAYARDVALLDIAASGDHETVFDPVKWETSQQAANDFYKPGGFVTLRGFEWTSNNFGHRNVYYRTGDATPALEKLDYQHSHYTMPPSEFYELIEDPGALIIPHHTLVGTDWDYHDRRERLVEIYSTWGRTEFSGNSLWDKPDDPRGGAQAGVGRGYRLGFIAGSDCHDSGPGRCYPGSLARNLNFKSGLMAVLAPALTREDIFDALWARRCYATTGERMLLEFTADGHHMGDEYRTDVPIQLEARVAGTDRIAWVEIIKNNQVLCAHRGANEIETLDHTDADLPPAGSCHFYYLRVTQEDGNMAWSSPIWVRPHDQESRE